LIFRSWLINLISILTLWSWPLTYFLFKSSKWTLENGKFGPHAESRPLNRFNPLIATWKPQSNGPLYRNTVIGNGRWWVGCYIWYSEEGLGRAVAPPSPLIAVLNVTAHPSAVSVPTLYCSLWHYNCLRTLKGWRYDVFAAYVVQGWFFRVQEPAEASGGEGKEVGEVGVCVRRRTVCNAHAVCRPDRRRLATVSIDVYTRWPRKLRTFWLLTSLQRRN